MTANTKWSLAVCDREYGYCGAQEHDPRCRHTGHHAHHINYKAHIPKFTHFTVVENGIWLSVWCHEYAHRTHNAIIAKERRLIAARAINAAILKREPHKPELLVSEAA